MVGWCSLEHQLLLIKWIKYIIENEFPNSHEKYGILIEKYCEEMGMGMYDENKIDWDNFEKKVLLSINSYITKIWGESVGREYCWIEANRLKKYLCDEEVALSWFVGKVSEEILVELATTWILTNFEERNILSQLKYKGIRYDYTVLVGELKSAEESVKSEKIKKELEELQNFYKMNDDCWNPKKYLPDIIKKIKACEGCEYAKLINEIRRINEKEILYGLYKEKQVAYNVRFESVYSQRIIDYIKVSESILLEILYKILVSSMWFKHSIPLEAILKEVCDFKEKISFHISEKCKKIEYHEIILDEKGNKTSNVAQMFVLYMQYKAYIEETKKIEFVLEKEIRENIDEFLKVNILKHRFVSEYKNRRECILDFEENKMTLSSSDYDRLDNSRKFIRLCNEKSNGWGDEDSAVFLRIIYRDIFRGKIKLPERKRNSQTIAKAFLNGEKIAKREELFLELIIRRGCFRELRRLNEYIIQNRIMQEYRDIMLMIMHLPTDILCYQMITDVFDEVLRIIRDIYKDWLE